MTLVTLVNFPILYLAEYLFARAIQFDNTSVATKGHPALSRILEILPFTLFDRWLRIDFELSYAIYGLGLFPVQVNDNPAFSARIKLFRREIIWARWACTVQFSTVFALVCVVPSIRISQFGPDHSMALQSS